MKKIVCGPLALLLLAGAAFALTLIVSVTAAPYTEVAGSGVADGPTHLYLSILPSAEIHKPTTIVTVYEGHQAIWTGPAVAVKELKIKSYTADAFRRYTVEIRETDGITVTAQLFYD